MPLTFHQSPQAIYIQGLLVTHHQAVENLLGVPEVGAQWTHSPLPLKLLLSTTCPSAPALPCCWDPGQPQLCPPTPPTKYASIVSSCGCPFSLLSTSSFALSRNGAEAPSPSPLTFSSPTTAVVARVVIEQKDPLRERRHDLGSPGVTLQPKGHKVAQPRVQSNPKLSGGRRLPRRGGINWMGRGC